ncbi:hypothetical protein FALCPG4_015087 [Fusarium falciforme]
MAEEGFELDLITRSTAIARRGCLEPFTAPHRRLSSSNCDLKIVVYFLCPSVVPADSVQNARAVREDTAELATYLLSDGQTQQSRVFLQQARISFQESVEPETEDDASTIKHAHSTHSIVEVSVPQSPKGRNGETEAPAGPSVLSKLLKKSPPQSIAQDQPHASTYHKNKKK